MFKRSSVCTILSISLLSLYLIGKALRAAALHNGFRAMLQR